MHWVERMPAIGKSIMAVARFMPRLLLIVLVAVSTVMTAYTVGYVIERGSAIYRSVNGF